MRFLAVMNPSVQLLAAANAERAFTGDAPTLGAVASVYTPKTAETWLMAQLENLNDFCGVRQKMSVEQMAELSGMLLVEVCHLKVSELMLFFHRFKAAHYGEFYGVVDPQRVFAGLRQFLRERLDALWSYERSENNRKLLEESRGNGITYAEYLAQKQRAGSESEG